MSPKALFTRIKKDFIAFEKERYSVIKISNEVLQKSKQAIFALHRDDVKDAELKLKEADKLLQNAEIKFKKIKRLRYEGSYKAAVEEYIEAKLFFKYMTDGKISEIKAVKINNDIYLGAMSDYTGELLRKAVLYATDRKFDEVRAIKKEMDMVMKELLELNLTGYLRTKYDAVKRNVKKIEEVMYDITIRTGN